MFTPNQSNMVLAACVTIAVITCLVAAFVFGTLSASIYVEKHCTHSHVVQIGERAYHCERLNHERK